MTGAEKVATAFIGQTKAAWKVGNVSFEGTVMKSYNAVLAVRYPHFVLVSTRYHSKSSRMHRGAVIRAAKAAGVQAISVYYVQVDADAGNHKRNIESLKSDLELAQRYATMYPDYEDYVQSAAAAKAALEEYTKRFELETVA